MACASCKMSKIYNVINKYINIWKPTLLLFGLKLIKGLIQEVCFQLARSTLFNVLILFICQADMCTFFSGHISRINWPFFLFYSYSVLDVTLLRAPRSDLRLTPFAIHPVPFPPPKKNHVCADVVDMLWLSSGGAGRRAELADQGNHGAGAGHGVQPESPRRASEGKWPQKTTRDGY